MSYENISPSKFKEFMKDTNSVVLDVRTPEEEVEGTIPGFCTDQYQRSFVPFGDRKAG